LGAILVSNNSPNSESSSRLVASGPLQDHLHQRCLRADYWNSSGGSEAGTRTTPFVFKTRDEFQTILDYLEDRITGTEVFQRFRVLQDLGMREKNTVTQSNGEINIPYRRSEGHILGKLAGGAPPILWCKSEKSNTLVTLWEGRSKVWATEFGVSPSTVKSALSTDTTTIHDE